MTTVRLTEKQAQINRERDEIVASYPSIWNRLIAEWNSSGSQDLGWLMYSANYLFRTRGVRWAIDPLMLSSRLPQAPQMNVAADLQALDFVLLTHAHKDHLDLSLLRELRHLPIRWVIPETILPLVQKQAGLPDQQIIVPRPLEAINLDCLRIIPFNGLHWEYSAEYPDGRRGMPATGYLIEMENNRWLFPGDTRHYDASGVPIHGPFNILFAHLWLGRRGALQAHPKYLNDFCRFCLAFQPQRIVLTHLEEWGRQAPDFWTVEHADQVIKILKTQMPSLPVEIARCGDRIIL
jgi:L-ascorbate metabolism protein UlaG (beta-lactamase superfamily)